MIISSGPQKFMTRITWMGKVTQRFFSLFASQYLLSIVKQVHCMRAIEIQKRQEESYLEISEKEERLST